MGNKRSTPIPGLSFSWKRALGITRAKQNFCAQNPAFLPQKEAWSEKFGGFYTQKV